MSLMARQTEKLLQGSQINALKCLSLENSPKINEEDPFSPLWLFIECVIKTPDMFTNNTTYELIFALTVMSVVVIK